MAQKGFLNIIKKQYGDGNYDGDQFGGAGGHDGTGLPSGNAGNFMFATGIECSYPTIKKGTVRRDQLRECGHYDRWREDLALVKDMGIRVLRYGLPYYAIHQGPGKYDWSFADDVMNEIKRLGITPILDLMHFGVPDWIGNFQNPELPVLFADYAGAVAKRYPWVRYYTPVNEVYVTARISAKDGVWNEQLKTDKGFVTALKHLVAASIMGNQQIAKYRNDCVIVQSESAEYIHEVCATPSEETMLANESRFLALDLLYANPPSATMCMYLLDNGMTRQEYDWFMTGEPPGYQIMGNDYYGRNERIKLPDGSVHHSMDVLGWYQMTRQYYERYHKPVMHTETNVFEADSAPMWLWKQWINVLQMRKDGVPVLGFTWYSLIDQIDWDTQLGEVNNRVNACGLYDLDRKPRPVAQAYRDLLKEFGQITIVPYGEMLEMTDRPARLKVVV
ncbi:glycoside hydrolase family 1 protein [Fibrisoma montanum]|uniref:Glycoside hydrolase family 1 protein n=1 Tax=Fibrisoma montanum TaxID=2305895 RepID=A0A418LYJ0_9BACT|nr:family 1 glycosylhydrolase [Fibrisoma montanum]RIV18275.1 glycoside hydrolase family 1 protein [Fibrisoma montanum]